MQTMIAFGYKLKKKPQSVCVLNIGSPNQKVLEKSHVTIPIGTHRQIKLAPPKESQCI